MMGLVDALLDRVTMYRLVLYYLLVLLVGGFVAGWIGVVPIDPAQLSFSLILIMAVCLAVNAIFARFFGAPENRDSVIITALILVLILDPAAIDDPAAIGGLVFASVWSTASKYIVAFGRKHIFNPAAFGVAASAILLDQPPTWWVGGNMALLPLVLLGGILVVRKIGRWDLVGSFALGLVAAIAVATPPDQDIQFLDNAVVYSPALFFAFVMLTEPVTTPPNRWWRMAYGALVGVLSAPNVHFGSFYLTPENTLLIGNLFAFLVSPKGRFALMLRKVERASANAVDFIFSTDRPLPFRPGQYLEFALGVRPVDSRGNRRFFTIASAPTEEGVRLGVKFNPQPSAFKRALAAMKPGDKIYAAQATGEFVLPEDRGEKLAFLAGGIGVTPFRSMLQHLIDRREKRPIVMIYASETGRDIAYRDVLDAAERKLGIATVYAVARGAERDQYPGIIDATLVRQAIPDYRERTFYISGPQAMVTAVRHELFGMGVHRSRIRTDFFPGLS